MVDLDRLFNVVVFEENGVEYTHHNPSKDSIKTLCETHGFNFDHTLDVIRYFKSDVYQVNIDAKLYRENGGGLT